MYLLAIDPGKVNFGFSVLEHVDGRYRVCRAGMIVHTIKDLKTNSITSGIDAFRSEISTITSKYQINTVVAERFLSRGLLGSMSEYINIMLGVIGGMPEITTFTLVTPATWKNAAKRVFSIDDVYKKCGVTHHHVDAALIGIYWIDTSLNKRVPFSDWTDSRCRRIVKQIATSA